MAVRKAVTLLSAAVLLLPTTPSFAWSCFDESGKSAQTRVDDKPDKNKYSFAQREYSLFGETGCAGRTMDDYDYVTYAEKAGDEDQSFHVGLTEDMVLETPYYSILIPADWMGSFMTETVDNMTGKWLKLFFIRYDEGKLDRGHLFSILLTKDTKYKDIPDHNLLGKLKDESGDEYNVVAVFPTDVQYSRENRDYYMSMFEDAAFILSSFKEADGCTYTTLKEG